WASDGLTGRIADDPLGRPVPQNDPSVGGDDEPAVRRAGQRLLEPAFFNGHRHFLVWMPGLFVADNTADLQHGAPSPAQQLEYMPPGLRPASAPKTLARADRHDVGGGRPLSIRL